MGLLTALTERFTKQREGYGDAYRKLVRDAAEDRKGNPDKAVEVIEGIGKSFAEFQADVDRMKQRLADAKLLQEACDGLADYQAATARLAELAAQQTAELEAIREQYRGVSEREKLPQRASPERYRVLNGQEHAARQRLIATADAAIDAEEEDVKRRSRELADRQRRLLNRKEAAVQRVGELQRTLKTEYRRTPDAEAAWRKEIKQRQREIEELQAEAQRINDVDRKPLQAESDAVYAKRLLP